MTCFSEGHDRPLKNFFKRVGITDNENNYNDKKRYHERVSMSIQDLLNNMTRMTIEKIFCGDPKIRLQRPGTIRKLDQDSRDKYRIVFTTPSSTQEQDNTTVRDKLHQMISQNVGVFPRSNDRCEYFSEYAKEIDGANINIQEDVVYLSILLKYYNTILPGTEIQVISAEDDGWDDYGDNSTVVDVRIKQNDL